MRIKNIFYKKNPLFFKRGITVVEVLFAVAIMASFIGFLSLAFLLYLQIATAGPKHTAAVFLADEGIEAVKSIRNKGWTSETEALNKDVSYHLYLSDEGWQATTTEQLIDETFTRVFVLKEIERNANGEIVDVGGVLDTDSLVVDVSVTWDGLIGRSEIEMSSYLMNIFD